MFKIGIVFSYWFSLSLIVISRLVLGAPSLPPALFGDGDSVRTWIVSLTCQTYQWPTL